MAKLQRWRRRSPAGEGESPVRDEGSTATETVADDGLDEDGLDEDEADPEFEAETDLDEDLEEYDDAADARADAGAHAAVAAGAAESGAADSGAAESGATDSGATDSDAADPDATGATAAPAARSGGLIRKVANWSPLLLIKAAHAKQAIATALVMAGVAVVVGRPAREVGVVLVTVLVGQTILGWHNDLVDRRRDARHNIPGKPVADGRLDPGTVWYALTLAVLLLVPLSITTGITAGCIYLGAVAVGMLGNVLWRTNVLSFWSWAVQFALYPAYLSYGGWGGQALGEPPETAITVLAALLGIGLHFMRAVWGLVPDHEDGWTYLPLKLGLKLGATRLLAVSTAYTAVIVVALAVVGSQVGLSR